MPRCNDCNKFVGIDSDTDAQIDVDVDPETGEITGTAEIENNCADCGSTLRTAGVDLEISAASSDALAKFVGDHSGCTFEQEGEDFERAVKTEGKGRGTRTFYGVEGTVTIRAVPEDGTEPAKDAEMEIEVSVSGFVQASGMDEA